MRIGINGSFWDKPTTGSGQYIRELVAAMVDCEPDNEYVIIVPQSEVADTLTEISPHVFLYPESVSLNRWSENLGKVWFEQVAFLRACRRERTPLAHIPYFAAPLFPDTRTVVTIHDLIPLILPHYRGSLPVRLYTRLVATSARRADLVIADSECSKRDIVERLGISPSRVHVVHLAANTRYRPVRDVAAIRHKYALPEKYLLYLGGFDQRKNVRVILEAFAVMPELFEEGCRLVLAGSSMGKESAFFPDPQRIAREVGLPEDAVRQIGWVAEQDKPALYSSAIAFLFPSLYEGFGLPPLEAMACGTPVIVSNVSSLPEIVGEAGLQIDPTSALAWALAIRAIVDDGSRMQEMRERGLAQAASFSWKRTAQETLAVYHSLE